MRRGLGGSPGALAGLLVGALVSGGCVPRPDSCGGAGSCGASTACIAGRCAGDGGVSSLAKTRRLLLWPTDVAFVQRGSARPAGALAASVTLGRSDDAASAVLLRFDVSADLDVVLAYLLVDRAAGAAGGGLDGAGVGLHAERIVADWSSAHATWLDGPEFRDERAPSILLRRGEPDTLRLDVTALMKAAARAGDLPDHGLALVADRSTPAGVAVALSPSMSTPVVGEPGRGGEHGPREPRLELYVK